MIKDVAADSLLGRTLAEISPIDEEAASAARIRQDRLTKPAGSLGLVEALGIQLSAIAGAVPPPIPKHPVVGVFAGDHGVVAQGVSPHPTEVTVQMALNMVAGGAAVSVLARQFGSEVWVTDVGVAGDLPSGCGVRDRRIASGTRDMSRGPAMSREQAVAALEVGIETANQAIAQGADVLLLGEMGIGNTTPAAALISVFTHTDPREVTGFGAGANHEMVQRKTRVIAEAIAVNQVTSDEPLDALAAVGGLEHAALAGFILGGAAARVPVIIDGVIACSAALVAVALAPMALGYLVAGHAGVEPGIIVALTELGLSPLVDLGLRLGEGSGALLALPTLQAAAHILGEMATFDDAAVTDVNAAAESVL